MFSLVKGKERDPTSVVPAKSQHTVCTCISGGGDTDKTTSACHESGPPGACAGHSWTSNQVNEPSVQNLIELEAALPLTLQQIHRVTVLKMPCFPPQIVLILLKTS